VTSAYSTNNRQRGVGGPLTKMNTKDSTGIPNQNAQKVRVIQPSKIIYKNNQLQVENTFLIKKT